MSFSTGHVTQQNMHVGWHEIIHIVQQSFQHACKLVSDEPTLNAKPQYRATDY